MLYNTLHLINTSSKKEKTINIPVICIGNIIAGGGGKTPTAIASHRLIKDEHLFSNPCFLTRGYGAQNKTTRVIEDHEPIHDTGDEPRILSTHCKTIISPNRYDGAKLAQNQNHDLIIMDDGFQNKHLKKDISFLVIDGSIGFGNKNTLPAGPLREPLTKGLQKADAIIFIGKDNTKSKALIPNQIPVFDAIINANTQNLDKSENYIAFCGLAHPSKFFKTLEKEKINIVEKHEFADHHKYTNRKLEKLLRYAKKKKSTLITTEKDMARIPNKYKDQIKTLPINLVFNNENNIHDFLKKNLAQYISSP